MSDVVWDLEKCLREELEAAREPIEKIAGEPVREFRITKHHLPDPAPIVLHCDVVTHGVIAGFGLHTVGSNDEVWVSYRAWVAWSLRNKGLGKLLNTIRLTACKRAGVKALLATVGGYNEPQLSVMRRLRWRRLLPFRNYMYREAFVYGKKL